MIHLKTHNYRRNSVDKAKPSRPRKAKRAPVKKVQPPEESTNKYAPKMKVGRPSIKAPGTNVVTTVGLGKLTVETINGRSTDTNV